MTKTRRRTGEPGVYQAMQVVIDEGLNHSSTHITREIYTHVTPPMRSDAADRVAEQIFGLP